MISNIAVPSSPEPVGPGRTVTAGRSPDACEFARLDTPSDSTPIFTPAPVAANEERPSAALCVMSPSDITEPVGIGDAGTGRRLRAFAICARTRSARAEKSDPSALDSVDPKICFERIVEVDVGVPRASGKL